MLTKKRLSPFSKEFWMNKGLSESEAEYKRNSIRPIRKEYWLEKGYSDEDACNLAIKTKEDNNKRGAKKSAERDLKDKRESSQRCVEFWIKRGYTEDDAKQKIREIQATFTIEKCIEKYGYDDGIRIWKERQNKWQNSLKTKSEKEITRINIDKNTIKFNDDESIDSLIHRLKKLRNMELFKDVDSMMNYLKTKNPAITYTPYDIFIATHVPNIQIIIFDKLNINYEEQIKTHLKEGTILLKGKKQAYRKRVKEGLLRSSYEIYFYETLKKKYPGIQIKLDGNYPNSNFRYDFLINDEYIEIAPCMDTDEKYRDKMKMKENVFGCTILKSVNDIDKYINLL